MTAKWLRSIRFVVNPRSWFEERGAARPPRASTIILGMTLALGGVVLLAKLITELLAAA
ncbi:hypothetical protein DEVEQU_01833 [Devosia equisanguinis]|jgi:hypothetical protein|uniref:DUF2970 domain-containing protein n=1 Tax=Devosia equisanguinis TaxID=2490941 RepID=A0A3S4DQ86_9HYPH|nr:hypothetical protein HMPREF0185_00471 [Brevundimonas diminuta 470-4]VDS04694.1 hypothetical protein DEVEQU_01833 [Devosia equisanguinis]